MNLLFRHIFLLLLLPAISGFGQNQDINEVKTKLDEAKKLIVKNPDLALKWIDQAFEISKEQNDHNGIIRSLKYKSDLFQRNSKYELCLYWGNQALEHALQFGNSLEEAEILTILASAYQQQYNYDKALEFNYVSKGILLKHDSAILLGKVYHNLGDIHFHLSNYDSALYCFFESVNLTEAVDQEILAVSDLFSIANVYLHLSNYELALKYSNQALAVSDSTVNIQPFVSGSTVKGQVFYNMGDLDSAYYYGNRAYEIIKQYKMVRPQMPNCWLMGSIYRARKQPEVAKKYFEQGLNVAKELNNLGQLAIHSIQLGQLEFEAGHLNQALEYGLSAYNYAKQSKTIREQAWSAELLHKIYEQLGQTEVAYSNYKEYILYRDSLAGKEKNFRLLDLERQYRTAEQAKKIAESEIILLQEKSRRQRIISFGLILLGILISSFIFLRYKLRQRQKKAEQESQRLKELDNLKSTFFANISHEFRTPLSLIISPVEQLINGTLKGDPKKYFNIIHRNGQRLLQMVNQLLDLSKLESGKLKTHLESNDLYSFIQSIGHAFDSLATRKNIQYDISVPAEKLTAYFDSEVLEKILSNLLSNAFKFTQEDGKIELLVQFIESENKMAIEVNDSGAGISPENLPKIFDRYFSESNNDLIGTGIGLALTRELVLLLKGNITVDSQVGIGSSFKFQFPVRLDKLNFRKPSSNLDEPATLTQIVTIPKKQINRKIALVVEDNPDLRQFIKDQLKDSFDVLLAEHGVEGLEVARHHIPDIIITDLMMPEMNGLELTEQLQADSKTSHIPIVMLTAKSEKEDRISGYQKGANAYLSKPFHTQELITVLESLARKQAILREKYSKINQFRASPIEVVSVDDQFLHQILQHIETHIDDELFGVQELAEEANMSRSQLHRKLKALASKSPNEIIREVRLNRAKELLEKKAGNASEVAFMVGFSSASYFSKCFKDTFGISPGNIENKP